VSATAFTFFTGWQIEALGSSVPVLQFRPYEFVYGSVYLWDKITSALHVVQTPLKLKVIKGLED
jgi:hypothetical protein